MYRIRFFMKIMALAIGCAGATVPRAQAQGPQLPAPEANAVERNYLHTVWTTEDGLPQNSVNAIVQTRDGYLWLATFGGLIRFDGVAFTVFDVATAPELVSNRTVSLYEDRAGTLWIGHETGQVTAYKDGVFTSYGVEDGLPGRHANVFAEDQAGSLWIGTQAGLVQFAEGVFTTYTTDDGLPHNQVYDLVVDRGGRLWVGTDGGVARYEDGRFTVFTMQDGLPGLGVGEVFEDRDGRLWVGTTAGLFYYRDGRFTSLSTPGGPVGSSIVIEEDRHGVFWVGEERSSFDRRLTRLMPAAGGKGVGQGVVTYPFDAKILVIVEDREGNVWIGTDSDGLHRFREKPVRRYTTDDGLPSNSVFRVIGDGEGGVWFNAGCDNLTRYRNGTFTPSSTMPDGGRLMCIWALLRDRAGVFWIGSEENLFRWDDQGYTRYTTEDGLPGGDVVSLFEDREGMLWVGTSENGVARFDGQTFRAYTMADGLVHGDVRFIMQRRDGALWFGTREGLSRFQDGVFTNITAEDGLSPGIVRALHEDADGTLWVGTYGGGLSRIKDGRITRYTMADGLFDNVVSRILEDDKGNLWMLGNLGLFFVNRQVLNDFAEGRRATVDGVSFGPDEGMAEGNGGGQPAGWQTDDGMMYFPTIDGLAVIDARNFRRNEVPPPVVIERVVIDERVFDLRQPLEAPPGQRNLEIRYTGLSLSSPQKVHFRYRLEGHDAAWQQAEGRRTAYYTNLAPGAYTFRVQAANNDGVWNETGAALAMTLKPFFYEMPWFYALCVLLLGWAGYTTFRVRTRTIQARNIRLQAEIIERKQTEEALRASEARYRAVVETQTELITRSLPDTTLTFVNDAYCQYFGKTPDELIGSSYLALVAPEDREGVLVYIQSLIEQPRDVSSEHLVLRPDGTTAWQEWIDIPIRDEAGRVVEFQSMGRDITMRKQAEVALRASEERFSKAFQAAPVPMILNTVKEGLCLDVNQSALDLFGYRREDVIGKTMIEMRSWDDPQDRARMIETMRTQGAVREMAVRFRTGTREARDVLLSVEFVELSGRQCLLGVVQDVTERKRAEEALRENEARLRAVVTNVPVVLFALDREGVFTLSEGKGLEKLGLAPGEVVGLSAFDVYGGSRTIVESLRRSLAGEISNWVAEVDGVSFDTNVFPLRDEQGQVTGIIGVATDITERVQAEQALRASEEKFSKAFRASPDAIIISSLPDGEILDVNDGFTCISGFRRDEVIGRTTLDLGVWADEADRDRILETLRADGRVRDYECRLHVKSGEVRICLDSAEIIELEGKRSLISVIRDVTERKQAEAALQASEEKFARAFMASPDALMLTTVPDGRITEVNDGFVNHTGFQREEVIGRTSVEMNLWADLEDRERIMQRLRDEETVRDIALDVRAKSGEIRNCLFSVELLEIGGQPYLVSITRDITEQKQAAEEREHLIAELEARNAELERFTYTVSHDLKTPLVTIKGFLGLLQQDAAAGDTERIERDMARIGSAADTMARLLSELLELSRIGRMMNPPEAIALSDLAREAVDIVGGRIMARGVLVEIDPRMPLVSGDRVRLLEVYQNLIDNAVKFMGEQPAPRIEVGAQQQNGAVVCYVKDNGVGIASEYHDNVFGLFNRLDADAEGTGIGLALVRRIVEVHGGKIWVESEGEGKGKGSTFYFTLPPTGGDGSLSST